MSKIDLNTNKDAILKLHKDVSDPKNKTDWVLYGYEGQSNTLKVIGSGDGGLEELIDELNCGRILYAYCSILDPNTNLYKFVIINWQGEGVPELKKGKYAHHIHDVKHLLKGAHVTIEARCDEDVDEDDIKARVAVASGSNYSVHKEKAQVMPEIVPVASVYKRTLANQDINKTTKNAFWERQISEENDRKVSECQKKQKEREQCEIERKERELTETQSRECRERERIEIINKQRLHERNANKGASKEERQQVSENLHVEAMKAEDERKNRANSFRDQRNTEAKSLISQRDNNPKSVFESRTSQFDETPRTHVPGKLASNLFTRNESQEEKPRSQPIQLPKSTPSQSESTIEQAHDTKTPIRPIGKLSSQSRTEPSQPVVRSEPVPIKSVPSIPVQSVPSVPIQSVPSVPIQSESPPPTTTIVEDTPRHISPVSQVSQVAAAGLPPRPASSDEEEEEDEDEDEEDDHQEDTIRRMKQDMNALQVNDDNTINNSQNKQTEQVQQKQETHVTQLSAMSEYDYQAAEENEISFDIGEVISNIEQIDEGWWIGTNKNGDTGMFPSNYVSLIQ